MTKAGNKPPLDVPKEYRIPKPDPDVRLDACISLKLSGWWEHYRSVRALADAWGVDRAVVERASAEADRAIARLYAAGSDQVEEARGRILPEIDVWMERAAKSNNYAAAAQLLKLKASIIGAAHPSIKEVASKRASEEAKKLTEEELIAKVRELLADRDNKTDDKGVH